MDEQIKLLLSRGKKLHAAKLLKLEKGLDIVEAKPYLERIERNMKRSGQRKMTEPGIRIEREVRVLLASRQERAAVQLLRRKTAMKRKEAYAYVESVKLIDSIQKRSMESSSLFSNPSRPKRAGSTLNKQDKEKLERDTRQILQEKGKVEAIKFIRKAMPMGLREGKELVDGLQQGRSLDSLLTKKAKPSITLPAELEQQARQLLAEGKKIHAIKLVCETAGLGLRQGKEYVESL